MGKIFNVLKFEVIRHGPPLFGPPNLLFCFPDSIAINKMAFDKNFMKKNCHFLTCSKFLICCTILRSGNHWPKSHKLAVYKKLAAKKSFSSFSIFSSFQHYHVLCNKFYEKTTICLNTFSNFL